jgi:foldase protein PrsA
MSSPLRKRLLYVLLAALGLILAGASSAACGDPGSAPPSSSPAADPVVVTVNGRPVPRSAVDAVRAEFRLGGTSDAEAKAVKEAISRELVRQEAERLGVVADPADVRRRRSTIAGQLGGEAGLAAALKRVPMSEVQLQRDLEDGVLREALQKAKFPRLAATPGAARAYYERHLQARFTLPAEVHLGAIRVLTRQVAENAVARLRAGRPFGEVARQFTNDAESRDKGGDLGWVLASSLPAPLRRSAAGLKPGAVGKPVEGPGGWYLLKLVASRPARVTPFAAVERRLLEELTLQARVRAMDRWLAAARKRATVTQP